ncbi:Noc2-domain-containing protein [Sodiomyces alkalinus F11]|uniref:Noc2-domain-containing protein n=1 Tax=Sodiomyces alkalinus (strain CBS 110278 / VKM F-3762 / F11) TaxID=1314773 RepID=A0A3N2PKG1_SODAK|nr:Noc2-domain-containing protein [Sodiomyces alkalinus F11]ROT35018.1 Noc2-domain-containing protein [Sodiomyces alkalinus F11]
MASLLGDTGSNVSHAGQNLTQLTPTQEFLQFRFLAFLLVHHLETRTTNAKQTNLTAAQVHKLAALPSPKMPPTKKNLKATKKFEKNHLTKTLDKRKQGVKVKQRLQIKAKKQSKRAKDAAFYKGEQEDNASKDTTKKDAKVSQMSVDDFFKGGFEMIGKGNAKSKGQATQAQQAKKSGKLGKRKRDAPASDHEDAAEDSADDDSMSDMSVEEQLVPSDSDEDDDDDAGSDADDDAGMSKKAMQELAEKDPAFFKFLREHDPEALDFDENADLAEVDALSGGSDDEASSDDDDDDDEQPKKKRKKENAKKKQKVDESAAPDNELTRKMVAKWKASMEEKKSLRAARQVVLAFRCAAHLNEDDPENATSARYTINSPQVFHDILITALNLVPEVIASHLPAKQSASGKVYVSTDTKKFQTLSIMIKTYTATVIHLLGTLSDDATLKLTISSLEPLLPFLLSFRKLLKVLVKTVVSYWARPASSETTKITAFLVLRRLIVIGDAGLRETTLKAIYQGFVQSARVTNHNTLPGINLMKNSAAELWGMDQGVGYTTAFTFIRQLAIHLRNSIVHNKDAAFRIVYNWQYTHSLDFWSTVLAEHCSAARIAEAGKESQLKLLIYPLVQVTLGAARLIPTATYFPLRFHLLRALLRLSRATGTYIPLAPLLLEVLDSAELRRAPKPASLKPLDFRAAYKAPKAYLRTRVYQDGVGEQVAELLAEFFAVWCKNIAFPEMALPVTILLKRWLKRVRRGETRGPPSKNDGKGKGRGKGKGKGKGKSDKSGGGNRNAKVSGAIVLVVQKLEANAAFIEEKRSKVDFAPKDRTQVEAFLRDFDWEKTPLGAYVVAQRKLRAEKLKMMEDARREDDRRRREEEGGDIEFQDEEDDAGEEINGAEEDEEEDDDGFDDDELEDNDDDDDEAEDGAEETDEESD